MALLTVSPLCHASSDTGPTPTISTAPKIVATPGASCQMPPNRWAALWIANVGSLIIVLGSWQLAFDGTNILVVAIGSAIAIVGAALFAYTYVVATGRAAA